MPATLEKHDLSCRKALRIASDLFQLGPQELVEPGTDIYIYTIIDINKEICTYVEFRL